MILESVGDRLHGRGIHRAHVAQHADCSLPSLWILIADQGHDPGSGLARSWSQLSEQGHHLASLLRIVAIQAREHQRQEHASLCTVLHDRDAQRQLPERGPRGLANLAGLSFVLGQR